MSTLIKGLLVDIPISKEGIQYSLHQRIYDRHLLTGYDRYTVAREYYAESSLGIGNGILRGVMELGIVGLWFGNMLVIADNCSEVVLRAHLVLFYSTFHSRLLVPSVFSGY